MNIEENWTKLTIETIDNFYFQFSDQHSVHHLQLAQGESVPDAVGSVGGGHPHGFSLVDIHFHRWTAA